MTPTTTFTVPAEVVAREVGKETVILDLPTGTYFGLDPVGARMWQLLSAGKSVAELCDTMFGEYDVERATLEADALSLAQQLVDKKLLAVAS
jgi:hypothetical protein